MNALREIFDFGFSTLLYRSQSLAVRLFSSGFLKLPRRELGLST